MKFIGIAHLQVLGGIWQSLRRQASKRLTLPSPSDEEWLSKNLDQVHVGGLKPII